MFTSTYRPKKIEDFIGNKCIIQPFIEWLLEWNPNNKKNKCALVSGICGIGKTLLVELILKKHANMQANTFPEPAGPNTKTAAPEDMEN